MQGPPRCTCTGLIPESGHSGFIFLQWLQIL
jgi:hypothetical protein